MTCCVTYGMLLLCDIKYGKVTLDTVQTRQAHSLHLGRLQGGHISSSLPGGGEWGISASGPRGQGSLSHRAGLGLTDRVGDLGEVLGYADAQTLHHQLTLHKLGGSPAFGSTLQQVVQALTIDMLRQAVEKD